MTSTRKSLLENVFSLSSLQVANYLAPLVVLPYLARVLGPAFYGEVLFSQAFIQFVTVFTDYGFMHNGSREVAVCRDSLPALRGFLTESLAVRFLLLVFATLVLLVLVLFVPPFSLHPMLHVFTFGMVIADVLTMPFYFIGLERMRLIAVTGIVARLLTIVGVIVLITEQQDFLYVTLIYSVSYLSSGLVAFVYALKSVEWKLEPLSPKRVMARFKANANVFITSASITASNAGNMLILRIYASPETVGIYGVVDKVIMAAISMANPVFHTLLPYISRLAQESTEKAIHRIRQSAFLAAAGGALFFVGGFFGSGLIVNIAFGSKYAASEPILQWLSAMPAGFWITMVLGNLYFIAFGKYRLWSRLFIGISIGGVLLALIFVGLFRLESTGIILALLLRVYLGLSLVLLFFKSTSSQKSRILSETDSTETLEI